jgi:hypothetical protein
LRVDGPKPIRLREIPLRRRDDGTPNVGAVVGRGVLQVVRSQDKWLQPFTGTVEITSGEIAEDLAAYMKTSEQVCCTLDARGGSNSKRQEPATRQAAMCSSCWPCAALAGHVQLLLAMCSSCWQCAALAGHVQLLLAMCSSCWPCAALAGHVQLLLAIEG